MEGTRESRSRDSAWSTVLAAGGVAGTLDIVFACVYWAIGADVPPTRILQSVAAGLLGQASFEGGLPTAALGLGLQYFIATTMAAAYWLAATRWETLWRRPLTWGAAYGLLLYVVMNHVVVPLSAANRGARAPLWVVASVVAHVVLVGVPIAVVCSRRHVRHAAATRHRDQPGGGAAE